MCQRVFRAGCAVRAGHVAVTWVVSWTLFLHDTDLRRCEEKGELARPAGFALLVLLSVLLYFAASLMDPGFVRADCELTATSDGHAELEDMMPGASTSCQLRRCGYCLLLPMRAKHCRVCKHCVRRYDHHCPWIGNCVGERNHRWFLLYLVAQLLALLWAVQTSWSGIIFAPTWKLWLTQNVFLLAALAFTGVFSGVVILLLGSHLYLASISTTTWEFMSRHRISYLKNFDMDENPFDRGVMCNLWNFFCVCRTVTWEKVHSRFSRNSL
ncbi:palmitoyltransferase ZDHHC12-A isoform X2 [Denticeps clupeoides]|uniref:palmitoyltransferase ZDHHC12-A isoform X2 n=1 Tax=Denticeps clupeoides TaxID=299321 RepID=UPI0010A483B6|nr:probable palmitoyltransferase ZDHHC12 isoform X2 [Denticeps clupeoides]